MRAALLERFGEPLTIVDDVDISAVAPDEVLVRTVGSGVCHSDRTMQNGAWPLQLPMIPGHEASGVVEDVGSAVTSLRPGDHVVACSAAFCGECEWCMKGLGQHCADRRRVRSPGQPPRLSWRGGHAEAYVGLGGFASQMLLHERALVKIPDEMPLEVAALLGCAVATGLGAVRYQAKVQIGQTVAVLGCGGVGLNVVQAARLAGAARIIAIDRNPDKLGQAKVFGATDVVNASELDAVEAVRDLTGDGVDHAIEVVGRTDTIEQAFAMLRTRGVLTVLGVTAPGERISVPADALLNEKTIQGSRSGSGRFRLDVPLYCRLYLDGRLLLDELVSAHIPLDAVNDALVDLDAAPKLRAVITFD